MTNTIAWLWWIGGTLAGVLGLLLLAWALFRDRALGRRRCPRCWYGMDGVPGLQCPECGRTAKREARLFRTRRRWRWAGVGVLLVLAGISAGLTPQVVRHGAWSLVPTDVLIRYVPEAGKERRYDPTRVRGSKFVEHPVSRELRRRVAQGSLTGGQWRRLLERSRVIRTRAAWPQDLPLEVELKEAWWIDGKMKFTARLPGAKELYIGVENRYEDYYPGERGPVAIAGLLESGTTSVVFDASVSAYRTQPDGSYEDTATLMWQGPVRVPVRAVTDFDDVCRSVDDPAITAALRRCTRLVFRVEEFRYPERLVPFSQRGEAEKLQILMIKLDKEAQQVMTGVAAYCCVELIRDEQVVERYGVQLGQAWRQEGGADRTKLTVCLTAGAAAPFWFSSPEMDPTRWRVRIHGIRDRWSMPPSPEGVLASIADQRHTLTKWDCDRYWVGSYEIPLKDLLAE